MSNSQFVFQNNNIFTVVEDTINNANNPSSTTGSQAQQLSQKNVIVVDQSTGTTTAFPYVAASDAGVSIEVSATGNSTSNLTINKIGTETNAQLAKRIQDGLGLKNLNDSVVLRIDLNIGDAGAAGTIQLASDGTGVPGITFGGIGPILYTTTEAGIQFLIVSATNVTPGLEAVSTVQKRVKLIAVP